MNNSLQDRVIALIPSKDLRTLFEETNHTLTDIELLTTVFHCAPDFASRIANLKMLESSFTGEIKAYAARIIDAQQQMLNHFLKDEQNTVFELHIRETPDTADEQPYLCRSFDAVLKTIAMYYHTYNTQETTLARYRIVKRRLFSGEKGEAYSDDNLGQAILLSGGVIHSVWAGEYVPEECDGFCIDCEQHCVHSCPYPCFTNHGDLVKYRQYDTTECFGVVLQQNNDPVNEYYIIPLNSDKIRYRDFKNADEAHEHVLVPLVEKVSADILPNSMQEDYRAYITFLEENTDWF